MVTVEPFYARFYIYQPGFPESIQHCCGNKPASIIKVPVVDGRFCIRQSQPKMKWTVRALFRPDIQMLPDCPDGLCPRTMAWKPTKFAMSAMHSPSFG
jgi:hypothetical protein